MSPESCALCGKNFGVFSKKKNLGSRVFCINCAERVKTEFQRRKGRKNKDLDTGYCPDIDCKNNSAMRAGDKCTLQ